MASGAASQDGSRGVRRKVDHLGRVVIPASMRRVLGIVDGDELEVRMTDASVVIRKPREACTFCGATIELREVLGNPLCWSCMAAVVAARQEERTATPGSVLDDGPDGRT